MQPSFFNMTANFTELHTSLSFNSTRYSKAYNIRTLMDFEPDYVTLFEFEKFREHESWRRWMYDNWYWSLVASSIYVCLVFGGQKFMSSRKPFDLKQLLTFWNFALAIFSTIGFFRTVPELIATISATPDGLQRSVCFLEIHNSATNFWILVFCLSKIVEFGDTAFIILRKKPLRFLHWYHHVTVCLFCWWAQGTTDPSGRWFATLNLFVHSLMYTYYGLTSMEIKLPRNLAVMITSCQIIQMFAGIVINLYSFQVLNRGEECDRPISNIYLALSMYASYFVLFANFFYNAYLKNRKVKTK